MPAVTSLDFAAQTVKGRTGAFTNLPALLLPKGLQPRLSYSVIVNITFFKCIQWILLCVNFICDFFLKVCVTVKCDFLYLIYFI